jgi:hypothetical protein
MGACAEARGIVFWCVWQALLTGSLAMMLRTSQRTDTQPPNGWYGGSVAAASDMTADTQLLLSTSLPGRKSLDHLAVTPPADDPAFMIACCSSF